MKYYGKLTDPKDLCTKEYVDNNVGGVVIVDALPTTDINEKAIYRVDDNYYQYDATNSKWLSLSQTLETSTGFTSNVKQWKGTKAEYDTITTKDENTLYNVTDDSPISGGSVDSVNGKDGTVILTGEDIDISSTDTTKLNTAINEKSIVSVSSSGTSTDEVKYITIDGVEKKIGGSIEVDDITIDKTSDEKLEVKDNGITLDKLNTDLSKNIVNKLQVNTTAKLLEYVDLNDTIISGVSDSDMWSILGDTTYTLTNKTIDADNNTISNLKINNFESGVIIKTADELVDNDTTLVTSGKIKKVTDDLKENLSNYIGAFNTKADLDSYGGTKTKNDYAIVLDDETHSNQTSRYIYTGSAWSYQYKVNNTPFTTSQQAAIDSGITSTKVAEIDEKSIVSVSDTGTSTNTVKYITIDGTESKLPEGSSVSVSATGSATSTIKYITIDGTESKIGGSGGSDVSVNAGGVPSGVKFRQIVIDGEASDVDMSPDDINYEIYEDGDTIFSTYNIDDVEPEGKLPSYPDSENKEWGNRQDFYLESQTILLEHDIERSFTSVELLDNLNDYDYIEVEVLVNGCITRQRCKVSDLEDGSLVVSYYYPSSNCGGIKISEYNEDTKYLYYQKSDSNVILVEIIGIKRKNIYIYTLKDKEE